MIPTNALRALALTGGMTALMFASGCGDDGGGAEVLECEGSCGCDEDTRTCSCMGGSMCTVESADDITLVCEGNARCDLVCDDRCLVECPGTAGCDAEMGDDSEAVCNGTGDCDYTCFGDCTVDCPGTSACTVRCPPDATCNITSCGGGMLTECEGQNAQACRTDCPPPLGDAGA